MTSEPLQPIAGVGADTTASATTTATEALHLEALHGPPVTASAA